MKLEDVAQGVKVWGLAVLTLLFIVLYTLAMFGKFPHANDQVLLRLEPIIAIIIGYFFGRVPSIVIEKQLAERLRVAEKSTVLALEARIEDLRRILHGSTSHDAQERVTTALRVLG